MAVKNIYKLTALAIVVVFLILMWIGVFGSKSKDQVNEGAVKSKPGIITVTKSFDYATSGNVEGLVRFSDFVVSGHYEKLEKEWDMGEGYMSNVYSFVIDNSIYGGLKDTINVAIPQYVTVKTDVAGKTYSANVDLPNKTTPNNSSQYILFLKKYEPANIYTPAAVPFQIEINSTGQTALTFNKLSNMKEIKTAQNDVIRYILENPNEGFSDEISGLSEEDVLMKISNAVNQK